MLLCAFVFVDEQGPVGELVVVRETSARSIEEAPILRVACERHRCMLIGVSFVRGALRIRALRVLFALVIFC
jgi:hypothetical protein